MTVISQIYRTLLHQYGRQNWWPVSPPGCIHPRYTGGPSSEKQKLEVIVGAILTQNTSWTNVEKAIAELNKRKAISIKQLCTIPQNELAQLIRSSGYFNQKAKKLKTAAQFLKQHPITELEQMKLSELREVLLGINGVGPETADSIMLYALGKPIFIIDAYTKRIFSRIGLASKNADYDTLQSLFQKNLRKNARQFNEYHALLVEHGKMVCKTKPLCSNCVLADLCEQNIS